MVKKYVFFIRGYNDWDNIAPIIYYLAKSSTAKIYICFYVLDLRYTELFKYLQKNLGHRIHVFCVPKKIFPKINEFIIRILNKFSRLLKIKKIFKSNNNVSDNLLDEWLRLIKAKEPSRIVVIFDRTIDPIIEKVKNNLKDLESIFVSCPHGPMTNVNRMMYKYQLKKVYNFESLRIDTKDQLSKYLQYYHYLIFADHAELEFNKKYCKPYDNSSFDKSRIRTMGSIRYCKEWLDHVENYTPKLLNNKNDKLKIVFFMKKFEHNVFIDEVYRTLKIFASFPNIEFYIKPHTRGMIFKSKIDAPNIYIDYESSSSYLINMADVIFFYGGTSIILEALTKKKLTVCLDYLDTNINIFDYYNACQILRCRDDLCFFLDSNISNDMEKNKASREKILEDIVYAKDTSISVPEKYVKFFEKL